MEAGVRVDELHGGHGQPEYAAAAGKPSPPSATATTVHGSMSTGGEPTICEPGDSAAVAREGLLERLPRRARSRRRSTPRTTRPARIRQVLNRSPAMPVNRACEVARDVVGERLLGARPGPRRATSGRSARAGSRRSSTGHRVPARRRRPAAGAARSQCSSEPRAEPGRAGGPLVGVARRVADRRRCRGAPTARTPVKCAQEQRGRDRSRLPAGVVGVGDRLSSRSSYSSTSGSRHTGSPAAVPAVERAARRARRRWRRAPPVRWPSETLIAPVRVATSTSDVGVQLLDGVREGVGQHEPPLGVGVGDLGGAAAVVADHVAGPQRVAVDAVLGAGEQAGHPDRAVDRRRARS